MDTSTQGKIDTMKEYLWLKYKEEDWHAVMDAAADLRELVVRLQMEVEQEMIANVR